MYTSSLIVGLLSTLVVHVTCHSWLHCTTYKAVISGQDYSENECNGYIRHWSSRWGAPVFGADAGVNYFGSEGAWCQTEFTSPIADMYDEGYPYGEWYVGDTVRLVWPGKNHANYECFSNIPDTSMKLYYNPNANATSDISPLSAWTLLADFQDGCTAGTDGCGFQNCPKYCHDSENATCYGGFQVTSDSFPTSGFYTLMWYWRLNAGSGVYTTCFEVFVHTSGGGDGTSAETPSPSITTTQAGYNDNNYTYYNVKVPLCLTSDTDISFNETKIIYAANGAYNEDIVNWNVFVKNEFTNGVNVTIKTVTDYDNVKTVTSTAYNYSTDSSTVCDSIEDEFNGDISCIVCSPGDMATYITYASDTIEITIANVTNATYVTPKSDDGDDGGGDQSQTNSRKNFNNALMLPIVTICIWLLQRGLLN